MAEDNKSQADGSGDEPEPSSFHTHRRMTDSTDNEVQRSLGRMEGKLDTALTTLVTQGAAILSLQLWRARSMGWVAGVAFVFGLLGTFVGTAAFKAWLH